MLWYYVHLGKQLGPISEEEFAGLVRGGYVTRDTSVWHQGMAAWQAYGTVVLTAPPGAVPRPVAGPWRSGKKLVMQPDAILPDRCVKCNAPSQRRLKRALSWHQPILYVLICGGVLLYLIVALLVRKTAKIEIGLCDAHFRKRRNAIITSWLIFLAGLLGFAAAIGFNVGWPALAGLVLVLGAAVYSAVAVTTVSPGKIEEVIWLNGCGREYLAEFPEWQQKH